jgi:hypothetical protein
MKRNGGTEVELKDEIQTACDHLPAAATKSLRRLTRQHGLTLASGDVSWLDGHWYVTHSGLLKIARRNRCHGIHVRPAVEFCDPSGSRWAFKATVYTSRTCRGFVGYGDADPSNVSPRVRGAEARVAETRAVNRALRKAYAIGLCSIEELGSFSGPLEPAPALKKPVQSENSNSNGNGNGHRLRDRLCLLIRQHQLDVLWSSSMPLISAARRNCATPVASRSRNSLTIWPNTPPMIATGCYASSTATLPSRKVRHEKAHPWSRQSLPAGARTS